MSIRCKLLLAAGLILAVNLSLGLHVLRAYKGAMTESGRIHQQTAETVTQAISVQVHFKKQVQEWKNILLRGHEPNLYAKYLAQFEQERQRVEELSGRLLGRLEPGSPSWQQAQAFEQAHQRLTQTYRQALLLFDREDPLAQIRVDRQVRGMDRPLTDLIDELILAAEYYKRDQLAQMAERLEQRENELLAVVLGLLLLSLLGLLVLAERIIARPISLAIQMAQSISAGSRHTQASIQGSGEMARLHQALQTMQANLLAGEQALNREKALLEQRVKERTRELRFVNEELARAAKAKDLFLAGMSHELRTPLTTLIGLTEMLRDQLYGPLNPAQQEALKTMDESAHHLLSLINDILDLAKVESGKIELHTDHVPLQQLIESSLSLVRSSAESKGQALEVKLDPRVALIQGDIRRLKQMLLNLLGNALKFTPAQGRIGIEVLAEAERKTVLIRVWDTGIGIDPEQFDKLFEPFVQLQEVPGGHNPGTGLGLTLVNRMALLHRGSISVQSTPGQGSCFNLRLPWDPEQNDPAALGHETKQTTGLALPTSGGQGAAILLAEDNPANREMTRAYLQRQGFAVTTASNGLEALSLARDTPPDLILMDVQLALIDGLEVTQKLRAMPGFAHLPIIALTAMAMPGDRERCLEAGMDDYISKPLGLKELLQLIFKWLR
ncbi:response regulator [Magnetovirga frankeli]|uniref:response regulator n=1 Tax=Magnetovirga frankeli TaxID=947516 RepID=UPI0012938574|nr:response regulator [gamma proteobacterium SS-5]